MLHRLMDERSRLERALAVPHQAVLLSRSVVLQRLEALFGSTRHRLNDYTWDSMSSPPSDPDLLVHVACDYLDHVLRVDERQPSFSQVHVRDIARTGLPASAAPSDSTSLTSSRPNLTADKFFWGLQRSVVLGSDGSSLMLHFDVVVRGELWKVRPGRHNVLNAIVLLLYSFKLMRIVGVESIEHIIGGNSYGN